MVGPGAAALVHVVPLLVRTLPLVLGATACNADVPLPRSTLFAVSVAAPVPPLATGSVPETSVVRLTVPAVSALVPVPLTTPVSVTAPVPPSETLTVLAVNADVPFPFTTPVSVTAPVPPLPTGSVPVTPVVSGSPVAFASVIEGPIDSTTLPVPVDTVTPVPPLPTGKVPVAEARLIGGRMDESVVMLLPYHTAGGASITGATSITGGT